MPNIKPIRTEKDYEAALARIQELMDAELGSPEGGELDVLVDLVELSCKGIPGEARHFTSGRAAFAEDIS